MRIGSLCVLQTKIIAFIQTVVPRFELRADRFKLYVEILARRMLRLKPVTDILMLVQEFELPHSLELLPSLVHELYHLREFSVVKEVSLILRLALDFWKLRVFAAPQC